MTSHLLRRLIVGLITTTIVTVLGVMAFQQLTRNPLEDLDVNENRVLEELPSVTEIEHAAFKRRLDDFDQYTTSNACIECHENICEDFHSHPMSISMSSTKNASPLEDYHSQTRFDALRSTAYQVQFSYEVQKTDAGAIHSEICQDSQGNELVRASAPIEYSVGSGRRGRSYLINRDGMLYMSPVTWYSEGNRWDMSPAYSRNNKHFERRIVDGCVICHSGLPNPDETQEHTFQKPAFLEESIGCERCHGPGAHHISFHKDKQKGNDPIVNPAKLPSRIRDSICFQCHLLGVGRIVRFNQSEFNFRPGDDITKIWAVFVKGNKVDESNDTEAVGQAEQMLASKCFKSSNGQLGCLSCHDPHKLEKEEARTQFFNAKCMQCHSDSREPNCSRKSNLVGDGQQSDSCIVCHMPKLSANDVPHTSQTDHRIPRYRLSGPVVGNDEERSGLYIFGNEDGEIPENEASFYRALLIVQNAEASGDRFMASRAIPDLQAWIDNHPGDVRALEAIGNGYSIVKDMDSAKVAWEKALKLDPDSELLLLRLTILAHDSGDLTAGINYAEKLVSLNPWHHEHLARLAHMLGQSGRLPEAIRFAERAVQQAPWDFQIQGWLSEAYRITGDNAKAELHQQLYEKLKPLEE